MTNNILDIQAEIDMLKQKLNQYDTKDEKNTQLQEPDSDSDSDSDTTSDSQNKTSLTKSIVNTTSQEDVPDVPEVPEDVQKEKKIVTVSDEEKKPEPISKETKKIIKEAYTKVRENLKVFEEIINRLIKQYNGLDLYDDEIDHLEGIYDTELETFQKSLKNIIDRLPVLVDLDEKQYDLLERRLELCENRFQKFIKSF
jgi:predicted MPP superfamily phosphohydrolase